MIPSNVLTAGSVLQSGGSGVSFEVLLLIGIAAAIVIALIWMLTSKGGGAD